MVESPLASNTRGTGEHKKIPHRPRQAGGKKSDSKPVPKFIPTCYSDYCNPKMYDAIRDKPNFTNTNIPECGNCEFRKVTKTNCSAPIETCSFEIATKPLISLTSEASAKITEMIRPMFGIRGVCSVDFLNNTLNNTLKSDGNRTFDACPNKLTVTKRDCVYAQTCDYELVKGTGANATTQTLRLNSDSEELKNFIKVA